MEVPPGTVVWAVGDIHGRSDLLAALVRALRADASASAAKRKVIVFLGDYVDRGPDSKGVLDILVDLSEQDFAELVFLRGNHEQKMVEFLSNPEVGQEWCSYGGRQTLESFGLAVPSMTHRLDAWVRTSDDLRHKLSQSHHDFLGSLKAKFELGGYFFCHAGVRPGVSQDQQTESDLLWIRKKFLEDEQRLYRIVVHGHTISTDVYVDHRRIGVDTGAYSSDRLSAVRLELDACVVVEASHHDGVITTNERRLR